MYQVIVNALSKSPELQVYALVDGALLNTMPRRAQQVWGKMGGQSLFKGISEDVANAGPLLFALNDAKAHEQAIALLRDEVSGQTAGSFILSFASLNAIADNLGNLLDVQLSDSMVMVMRFFDPRILPNWLTVIEPPYPSYLAEVIHCWAYWQADQTPCIQEIHPQGNSTAERPEWPMQLSQEQEDKLTQHSYPYLLLEQFKAYDPQALVTTPPAQRYAFLDAQIQRGKAHGLDAHGDLQAYCAVALQYGADFDKDARVSAALARVKTDQLPFDEAIDLVPNAHWQQLERKVAS